MSTTLTVIQIIACISMFTTATLFALLKGSWQAIIPGITSIAYFLTIRDKAHTDMYRYGDWALTMPLMLLALLMNNNVTNSYIQIVLFLNVLMVASGYFSVKTEEKNKKWLWFFLGLVIFAPIAYVLYSLPIEKQASMFILVTYCLYQLIWVLNTNYIMNEDVTNISYALLDVVTKVGLLNLLHI